MKTITRSPCNGVSAPAAAALVALVPMLAALGMGCGGVEQQQVPRELVGRWVTEHPDYAGRSFEVTPSTLTIDPAVEPATTHTIVAVEEEGTEEGRLSVTLVYQNESGDRIRFPLTYDPDSDRLWPRHQPSVVWERAGGRR